MQIRDLTIIPLQNEQYLVTAVDISAAIGEKEHDVLKVPPEQTGKMAVRVGLLEVMASGAEIIAVHDVVGAEMEPTGRRVINGIQEELQLAGLGQIELNGSTEENMATAQTSVGVIVIGLVNHSQLKVNNVKKEAILFGYGEPRMGNELLENPDLEVTYDKMIEFVKRDDVLELVPVGSKGILYEAGLLAQLNDCTFIEEAKCNRSWLNKSAGPATSLLIAVILEDAATFKIAYPDAFVLGKLVKKSYS